MHALRPGPLRHKVTDQHLDIDGQRVRVSVRHGRPGQVPLLLINGIGARLHPAGRHGVRPGRFRHWPATLSWHPAAPLPRPQMG